MAELGDNMMVLTICLATIVVLIFATFARTRPKGRRPPSPPALPIIGHLHLLRPIPHQALHKLSTRYGPILSFYLGSKHCVHASTPEIVEQLLKTNETCFLKRPNMSNFHYLTYNSSDFSSAPYGPRWKLMKKLCMSELLGPRTLDKLLPIRRQEIRSFLKMAKKKAETRQPIDVVTALVALSNKTISRMSVSHACSVDGDEDEVPEISKMMREMNELGMSFNLADVFWFCKDLDLQGFKKRLVDVRDRFDAMMERIMKGHEDERRKRKEMGKEGEAVKDLLDILLDMYEDESSEIKLTKENIKGFLVNIFGASTDTSATAIGWALSELINNPNVMEKAREEIDSVVGKDRILEESDVANLPYLQAIVKESLRLHPSGPFIVRESTEACVVDGYEIPAGTRLFINVWTLGRNPKQWKNPLEFRPERFLNKEEWQGKSQWLDLMGQNFNLLPFGSGRRGCPGASLALSVVSTVLGCMIQCFDWKPENGVNGTVDMEEGGGMILHRANDLICVPVPRLDPFPSI